MSQIPQPVKQVAVKQEPSNGMGISGFIVSLVGLLTCGFLCPLGLLLSFLGLFKPPRGLAIAGTVIGAVGSAWLVFFGFALVIGLLGLGSTNVGEAAREAELRIEQEAGDLTLEIDEGDLFELPTIDPPSTETPSSKKPVPEQPEIE